MKRPIIGNIRKVILASLIAILAILIGLLGETIGDDLSTWLTSKQIHPPTIYVVLIICTALTVIFVILDNWGKKEEKPVENLTGNIEADVITLVNLLKVRYENRYKNKLDERFEITLEVREAWQGRNTQTINERYDKNAKISDAFPKLKSLIETTNGFLIAGEPGAGKTVLLLKVALNLLDKTNLADKESFPVVFNLASWNEDYKDFGLWLKEMLVSGDGLSNDFAAQLLHEKRIIFLLDGLDELARNEDKAEAAKKRAACLDSLNNYLDGQKTIICCRTNEFIEIQRDAPVSAQVKILSLTEVEVTKALGRAQNDKDPKHHTSAKNLSQLLAKEENEALRKILCTPFYFTIALEVFYKHNLEEIYLPKDRKKLGEYLIEKYVERKLEKTPNPNNFDNAKTRKWLGELANLMESKQIVIFELSNLQPEDLNKKWHFGLIVGMAYGFINGFLISVFNFFLFGRSFINLFLNFLPWLVAGAVSGILGNKIYNKKAANSSGFWKKAAVFALIYGLYQVLLLLAKVPPITFLITDFFYITFFQFIRYVIIFTFIGNRIYTEDKISFDFSKLFSLKYWAKSISYSLGIGIIFFFGYIIYVVAPEIGNVRVSGWELPNLLNSILYASIFLVFFLLREISKIESLVKFEKPYQKITAGIKSKILTILSIFFVDGFLIAWIIFFPEIQMSFGSDGQSRELIEVTIRITVPILTILILKNPLFLHTCLRICLYYQGIVAMKYATFLDYAAETGILEKDGGQWRFRHQNLQEYFADLKTKN